MKTDVRKVWRMYKSSYEEMQLEQLGYKSVWDFEDYYMSFNLSDLIEKIQDLTEKVVVIENNIKNKVKNIDGLMYYIETATRLHSANIVFRKKCRNIQELLASKNIYINI